MITSAPLRVLFDASLATNPAGTGGFVRGLLAALRSRTDIELTETSFESDSAAVVDLGVKSAASRLRSSLSHLRFYLETLPRLARETGSDLIYCPTPLVPLRGRATFLTTVHDLTPIRFPATEDWLSRQYLARMIVHGIGRGAGICTVSRAVAAEIVARFGVSPDRMHVIYQGPNQDLLQAVARPVPMPDRPFALMVGTVEPRKNHLTAVRALGEHRRRHPGSDLMLVAAGSAGWSYGPVVTAIAELGLADHVLRLGSVRPGELKWLYGKARTLLFPSIYEGFGLPVLEALGLRCPVTAADIPSVAEIIGSNAGLLPPTEISAWADALDQIASGAPVDQARLEAGVERARQFTWDGCATAAVAAMRAALEEKA